VQQLAIDALNTKDTPLKIKLVENLYNLFLEGGVHDNFDIKGGVHENLSAGFPDNLELVHPKKLQSRKGDQKIAKLAMLHSIAHIEFNAINLALDAMLRFTDMPQQYYVDWLKVAREEAYHFKLLNQHMNNLGAEYGDFPAHNGLWGMALDTQHSVLVRMALVPRLLEARGLDMAPIIMHKLKSQQDIIAYKILWIILHDEVGHVSIGNKWYHYCCQRENVDPLETFKKLLQKHAPDVLKKPFNWQKRLQAGFNQEEQRFIEELVG
jgi:uncharacterized ferritin-like protein (DUF455 family)